MRKTMKRIGAAIVLVLTMLTMLLPLPAMAAETKNVFLYDEGGRLTQEEYDTCFARLQEAANKTGLNVGVILATQERSDYTIESAADQTYDDYFGAKTDGLLYYMDLKGHDAYDYISTSGLGQFYITNSIENNRVESIFSVLDSYLYPVGRENVSGAVQAFAEQVEYWYEAGVPEHYYVYDDLYHEYYHLEDGELVATKKKPYINWAKVAMLAFGGGAIGLLAAFITFFAVKHTYKFKYELSPTTYVNRKSVQFNKEYDRFVRTNTSRVPLNSGSSGGRGGGHSGGGFSHGGHGGGGHHR